MTGISFNDKQFIREHLSGDVKQLALQSKNVTDSPFSFILTQIAGRQQIKNKIPSWYPIDDIIYPTRLPLEQCSSEVTAKYKASLLSGDTFADLTGGLGVDTAFIAPHFKQAAYVEWQPELAEIVRHNFSVLGLQSVEIHAGDGMDYLRQMERIDVVYIDPARRSDSGEKVMLMEDCEPDLLTIQDLLLEKAQQILIKLSPMLDIKSAVKILKNVREIHVVSVENECKELLFLLERGQEREPTITCVNFRKKGDHPSLTFTFSEEQNIVVECTETVKNYLYEPNASILKAGCYKGIALRYKLEKLHPDSHLYTSSELISGFPGRIFVVEAIVSMNKKELKAQLTGVEKANISVRNFPLPVVELRKRLKIKERGETYLFATTLANGKHVIINTHRI
jgi:16S rRNA G966 N2-methylase RsmD